MRNNSQVFFFSTERKGTNEPHFLPQSGWVWLIISEICTTTFRQHRHCFMYFFDHNGPVWRIEGVVIQ